MKNLLDETLSLRGIVAVGLLVALGTLAAPFSIPIGVARVYPVQHCINVLAGVLLGPGPGVLAAILTSTLRNLIGTGTPLAFPGSIFGALLAGLAFRLSKRDYFAAVGEVIGTGFIGALVSFPVAKWLLGFSGLAYAFIVPFALSSLVGAIIGLAILRLLSKNQKALIWRI
ncbi:MAG: energy coupling factor transporter S component ThiW [Dethiobacteria bacterium]